jgi:hypothetical protein
MNAALKDGNMISKKSLKRFINGFFMALPEIPNPDLIQDAKECVNDLMDWIEMACSKYDIETVKASIKYMAIVKWEEKLVKKDD